MRRDCRTGPADAGCAAPAWAWLEISSKPAARDLKAEGPMVGQVTDAVEFRVVCVKRHLSHVEGLYDEVVAHSISRFLNMTMVLELLAVFEGGDTTLLHPDRGR